MTHDKDDPRNIHPSVSISEMVQNVRDMSLVYREIMVNELARTAGSSAERFFSA